MSQQFCLKWNNHTTNMLQVFENLLTTEALVDVTLACDGLSLKAHKMVLSACSPFFQSLFLENPCKHPIVIMKDMRYCDLKAIIDFMYRGEVNVSHDQLSALLKTAETLKVKGLAEVTGENRQASGMVQQEIVQQNTSTPTPVPIPIPPTAQRTDTPPLQGKRKRGRPRKRSLSDSNRSDDEGVPSKIKETNSDIEELSGDASMEAKSDNLSGGGPVSCNSQSQVPIHSSNNVNNFSKSHLSSSQDPQVEEPVSGDENEFEVEPSKLLEQTLTTENVPSNSQNSTGPITLPSVSGLEISRRSMSSTDSASQALVPVSIPSDSLGSNLQGPDSPQDVKPQILSFDDPPISPVAGTSHGSDRSLMMYMDQSGVASIPGPSNFQDNSALVPHDSQPQDTCHLSSTTSATTIKNQGSSENENGQRELIHKDQENICQTNKTAKILPEKSPNKPTSLQHSFSCDTMTSEVNVKEEPVSPNDHSNNLHSWELYQQVSSKEPASSVEASRLTTSTSHCDQDNTDCTDIKEERDWIPLNRDNSGSTKFDDSPHSISMESLLDESLSNTSSEDIPLIHFKQSKSKKVYPSAWKRNLEKLKRSKSKVYKSSYIKKKSAKQPRPVDCSSCRYRCMEHFSPAQRVALCLEFWAMDFVHQKEFLLRNVEAKEVKRRRPREDKYIRKTVSNYYYFSLQTKKVRVCRDFFCKTLCISPVLIKNAFDQRGEDNICQTNKTVKILPKKSSNKPTSLQHSFSCDTIANEVNVKEEPISPNDSNNLHSWELHHQGSSKEPASSLGTSQLTASTSHCDQDNIDCNDMKEERDRIPLNQDGGESGSIKFDTSLHSISLDFLFSESLPSTSSKDIPLINFKQSKSKVYHSASKRKLGKL